MTLEVLKKLAIAREIIKNTKLKKAGENKFSNYVYFTPEQIDKLAYDACSEVGIITMFNLVRNELGVYGVLSITDLDSGEVIEFEQATEIPAIKATNAAQQIGGAVTYTERYLTMTAFGIKDNSLDFDTTENTKKHQEEVNKKKEITQEKVDAVVTWAIKESKSINDIKELYDASKYVWKSIEEKLKNK